MGRYRFSSQIIGIKGKGVKNGGHGKKSEKMPPHKDVTGEILVNGREYFY